MFCIARRLGMSAEDPEIYVDSQFSRDEDEFALETSSREQLREALRDSIVQSVSGFPAAREILRRFPGHATRSALTFAVSRPYTDPKTFGALLAHGAAPDAGTLLLAILLAIRNGPKFDAVTLLLDAGAPITGDAVTLVFALGAEYGNTARKIFETGGQRFMNPLRKWLKIDADARRRYFSDEEDPCSDPGLRRAVRKLSSGKNCDEAGARALQAADPEAVRSEFYRYLGRERYRLSCLEIDVDGCCRAILEHFPDQATPDALTLAVASHNRSMVRALLALDVAPDAVMLLLAIEHCPYDDTAELLLDAGAPITRCAVALVFSLGDAIHGHCGAYEDATRKILEMGGWRFMCPSMRRTRDDLPSSFSEACKKYDTYDAVRRKTAHFWIYWKLDSKGATLDVAEAILRALVSIASGP